jgi:hypothetical protein
MVTGIRRNKGPTQPGTILLSTAAIFGGIGLVVPLMFDRDVGGALASALLAIGGSIIGGIIGAIIVKRALD